MFFFKVNIFQRLKKEIKIQKKLNFQRFDYNFYLRTLTASQLSILIYQLNQFKEKKLLIFNTKNLAIDLFFKHIFFFLLVLLIFFCL